MLTDGSVQLAAPPAAQGPSTRPDPPTIPRSHVRPQQHDPTADGAMSAATTQLAQQPRPGWPSSDASSTPSSTSSRAAPPSRQDRRAFPPAADDRTMYGTPPPPPPKDRPPASAAAAAAVAVAAARIQPAMGYFQAYAPLASSARASDNTSSEAGPSSSSSASASSHQPSQPPPPARRRMSRIRTGSAGDFKGLQASGSPRPAASASSASVGSPGPSAWLPARGSAGEGGSAGSTSGAGASSSASSAYPGRASAAARRKPAASASASSRHEGSRPPPLRSGLATAQEGGTAFAMRRAESSSESIGSIDSATEEAIRSVSSGPEGRVLRDGRTSSWGWTQPSLEGILHEDDVSAAPPSQRTRSALQRSRRTSLDGNLAPAMAPRRPSLASIHTTSTTSSAVLPNLYFRRSSTPSSSGSTHAAPPLGSKNDHAALLQSPRLTRLVQLSRPPFRDLSVSLSDVGAAAGHPVIVFLGLGGVRYLTALFDELAAALGLRLVCIDRFGLGKSDDVPADRRGFLPWAAVVEEVADQLGLGRFSVLAHSAGTPFAMATCLRLGKRVVGSVNLLAPWVGLEIDGGYKWLRYVPTSVIKTAQAAEWRMQGWMLGKPLSSSPQQRASALPSHHPAAHDSAASRGGSSPGAAEGGLEAGGGLPHEAMAYLDLDDHGVSPPASTAASSSSSETTDYPLPHRSFSPRSSAAPSSPLAARSAPLPSAGAADLGTLLLRACHAENAQGGTADLLAITRRTAEWGFAYTDVEAPVKVWYGDRDDKISEKSVRWLERELPRCTLAIKKGEGHNLLSSTRVVVEVLESIAAEAAREGL